jgi:hypothetical protein
MVKKLILIAILAGAVLAAFIYFGGGKYVKKAAEETYEVGEEMEVLEGEMKEEGKKVKKKIDNLKKEFKGEED